jgi:hypothetical protein
MTVSDLTFSQGEHQEYILLVCDTTFFMALQFNLVLGHLILRFLDHTETQSPDLNDQPTEDRTRQTQSMNIYALIRILTRNPSN